MEFLVRRPDEHRAPTTACMTACRSITASAAWSRPARCWCAAARCLIRDQFSVRHFWDDVFAGDCTIFQYIGELCRYLVNAPEHPNERAHRLRLCCGNGLQADIWKKFQDRFVIPRILEFYAATEGNVSLYNVEGKVGADRPRSAVPRLSAFPLALVQVRSGDRTSRCATRTVSASAARANEAGEAIGRIPSGAAQGGESFEGYTDRRRYGAKNSAQRFRAWRRLVSHRRSHAHGRKRLLLFRRPDRRHLPLEGRERRDHGSRRSDHGVFRHQRSQCLWRARAGRRRRRRHGGDRRRTAGWMSPRCARIWRSGCRPMRGRYSCAWRRSLRPPSTFKHTKNDLQRDGFDPAATGDAIYFDDPASDAFVPLDQALYERIKAGVVRF